MNLGNYVVPMETENGICVDVGCNLGDFTAKHANHFQKIYFVEPQINLFVNLKKRFSNDENIIGLNNAVWSDSGLKVNLVSHPNDDCGSVAVNGDFINSDWTKNIVNEAITISLEDLLNNIPYKIIDYLKIDCETSEYPFIFGKDISMFKYIGIEIHAQLGEIRYVDLLQWIKKTHILINGDDSYNEKYNKELLFKLI